MHIIPVILCGGSGSRLWPLSRTDKPKQFIPLLSEKSPLQETIQRLQPLSYSHIVFIANEKHHLILEKEIESLPIEHTLILEPFPKNTAPALTLASLLFAKENPTFCILPADHYINADDAFYHAIACGYEQAVQENIVCFGVNPHIPETGYGYIHKGKDLGNGAVAVKKFVEKPSLEKAKEYIDSKEYCWNSGMFMVQAKTWLTAMEEHAPVMLEKCTYAVEKSTKKSSSIFIPREEFSHVPSDSIDYTIMEKTKSKVMVPLTTEWSDIGSFDALYALHKKDENNNVCHGNVVALHTTNSYIHSSKKLITTFGVDNLLIIETPDALLIANKNNAQDVKKVVEYLKEHMYEEVDKHHIVHRPWGQYETIYFAERFQVKCITVHPGESLSLQLHYHRAEHWIVVQGTGKIYNDDTVIILHEDQSTYIPLGTVHRLENPGKIPLQIIEVQTGTYLGEDDIVRLEDKYERG